MGQITDILALNGHHWDSNWQHEESHRDIRKLCICKFLHTLYTIKSVYIDIFWKAFKTMYLAERGRVQQGPTVLNSIPIVFFPEPTYYSL